MTGSVLDGAPVGAQMRFRPHIDGLDGLDSPVGVDVQKRDDEAVRTDDQTGVS